MHPTKRQNFAGKPYSTFWNIWNLLMYWLYSICCKSGFQRGKSPWSADSCHLAWCRYTMLSVVRCCSWWHLPLIVTQACLWKYLGLLCLECQDWYKFLANHHTYNQSTKKYQPKHERVKSFNLCLFHTGPDHQDLLISGFWRELHSCSNALTQEYFETLSDEMI